MSFCLHLNAILLRQTYLFSIYMISNETKKSCLFLFLFFISAPIFAQLSGTVLDENGEPLPYASVYVRNSTNGTVANANGAYKLALSNGEYDIVFQYIGYKQKIEHVVIAGKPIRLTARLEPRDLEISEVVITTEDPAYPIMRKAIAKRDYYKSRTAAYTCDAYIKGFYKLDDAPKKILGKEIGDMGGILDSNRTGVIYLSESVSQLFVQAKPPRKKEVMVSSKVSGSENGFSLNRATLTDFNLYDEHINVDRDILSPLADNAFSYYWFRLLGRYKDENGYDIYKIEVVPKRDEDPVFHGYVYIVDEWWNLAGADLNLTGKAIKQPILDTMNIHQEFVPVNKPDQWCLLSQVTGFKFGILGFKIKGFFNGVFSNYNLNPTFEPGVFNRESFRIEEQAGERDTSYWAAIRPVPLTGEETHDYVRKDSLAKIWESKAFLDSTDHKNNRFRLNNLIFGYTWQNSYRRTSVSYPSLINGVQFNTVQGWLIDFRPTFTHADDKRRTRSWEAEGDLNYGFSEKRLRGGLRLKRRFESIHYTTAEIAGGLTASQFDADKQIGEITNLLYSLLARKNYLKLYEKAYVRAAYSRNIATGLRLQVSAEYADRRPLLNHSDYSFYSGERQYSLNTPLPAASPDPAMPFFEPHRAALVDASLRIRFKETYSSYPGLRQYEGSPWPEVHLSYRKAIPGIGNSVVDYDLVQVRLEQRDLSMGLFGYSEWNLGGGAFWRSDRVEFMDHYHPHGNQTILGKPGDYIHSFFLLPYYEFSTSDAWAEAHLRHHFNGWLLDKTPLLRKLNWKETFGFNIYYAEQYAGKEQRPGTTLPYWEISFGFENIGIKFLRPLHVEVAAGFFGGSYQRTGVVLGLDL